MQAEPRVPSSLRAPGHLLYRNTAFGDHGGIQGDAWKLSIYQGLFELENLMCFPSIESRHSTHRSRVALNAPPQFSLDQPPIPACISTVQTKNLSISARKGAVNASTSVLYQSVRKALWRQPPINWKRAVGHSQTLHETRHGSMTAAKWLVDSPDDSIELDGHRFGSGDDGAPMLCNLVRQISCL